ncbi:MAG: SRPBCC family protein [Ancalomicrobiaceae bacterium]|nr:SRPBCC family protein [Ancalomicrobiaceae bacterium]
MQQPMIVHTTFTIDRRIAHPPKKVFGAFSSLEAKSKWFGAPVEWRLAERSLDFRVGGREVSCAGPSDDDLHRFDALYHDIVPDRRIIYSYEMHLGDVKISVSLATFEFEPDGDGTHLRFTEQAVFLDGYDDAGSREHGTRWLIGKLADVLDGIAPSTTFDPH